MGSGGSTAGTSTQSGNAGLRDAVTCPLFYNGMPTGLVIPEGVLPHVDPRKVLKGCAARVTMLRPPVAVPVTVKNGKAGTPSPVTSFLSGTTMNSSGQSVGVAEMSLSAPYLIAFTVDADGRLAPSDGENHRATPTTSGATGIKGFNFKKANDKANDKTNDKASEDSKSPLQPPAPSAPLPAKANHSTRSPAMGHGHVISAMGASSSPSADDTKDQVESVSTLPVKMDGSASGAPSPSPIPMAVRLPQSSSVTTHPAAADGDTASTATGASVHSVLVKDSTLLVRENSMRKETEDSGRGLGPKKRSSRRQAKLQVPHRTRYCLFNDSATHEAQIVFTVLFRRSADPLQATKVLCKPTPHVASTAGVRPTDSLNSASRTYVEVVEDSSRVNPETFITLLRPPATPEEKLAHESIRPSSKGGAAAQVTVVLAPGATVAAVESSLLLGYHIQCVMVPFADQQSLAVMGRYASAEQVKTQMAAYADTPSTSTIEAALIQADAKNKTQDMTKNKPIKHTIGFVTQNVRQDTTDADGWGESIAPLPHARTNLERHLGDVPYVSTSGAGRGGLGTPSRDASPLPPSQSPTPASSAPGSSPAALPALPPANGVGPPTSLVRSARGRGGGRTPTGPSPPAPPRLVPSAPHDPGQISTGGISARGQPPSAPPLEVAALSTPTASITASRMPWLAEPPSPTRSPVDRSVPSGHGRFSTASSLVKRPSSEGSPVVATAQQRSLAGGPIPRGPSSSVDGPVPKKAPHAASSPRAGDSAPSIMVAPRGEKSTPSIHVAPPVTTTIIKPQRPNRRTEKADEVSESSIKTQSLDDLGISF